MKKLIYKLIIIYMCSVCLFGTAGAITIPVSDTKNWSELGSTSADDVVCNSGAILTLDVNNAQCNSLRINAGVFRSTGGKKLTTNGFLQNGGSDTLRAGDSIILSNANIFSSYDFDISGGSSFFFGTNANPVVIRVDPTLGRGQARFTGASTVLNWTLSKYVQFRGVSGLSDGGLNFLTLSNPNNTTIYGLLMDTSTGYSTSTGLKLDSGWINNASDGEEAFILAGNADTMQKFTILNHGNQNGIWCSGTSGSQYLYADTVDNVTTSTAGIGIALNNSKNAKIINCKVTDFYEAFRNYSMDSALIQGGWYYGNTNAHILFEFGISTGSMLQFVTILGSTTRGALATYDGAVVHGLRIYYCTIGSWDRNPKAPISFDCNAATGCNGIVDGLDIVGTLIYGSNTGFNLADIWVSGGYSIGVSRFSNNAIDKIDTSGINSHFNFPSGAWPGTNKVTSAFSFVDSGGSSVNLKPTSPMINMGDSAIFVQTFGIAHAADAPGDIGAYQTFTGSGASQPPQPLSSGSVDTLHNDYSGENDSIRTIQTTGAEAGDDSVLMLWSTSGYRTDSTSTTNAIRRTYTASTTYTDTIIVTSSNTEPYTLYISSWVWDSVKGWSSAFHAARYFGITPTKGSTKVKGATVMKRD